MREVRRGLIRNLDGLRERCDTESAPGCWLWLGGTSHGEAVIWAYDHTGHQKRALTGRHAAFRLMHDKAPAPGVMFTGSCMQRMCVCPDHIVEHENMRDLMAWLKQRKAQ